ncbi:PRC-barrel domain-containing protein [Nonomuraea sp. CA-218870]|uniref:PRC-barrel domain-containing protein n=1 Tax=Nonomuraea sp. CA-218870 TaxID=3239998 RepID=UPI003D91B3CB
MSIENVWEYREEAGVSESIELVGYKVEATDGHVGSVSAENNDVGNNYLVVDTGPWIFGKEVLLPAGTVSRIDSDQHKIFINRTKQEIKDAPRFHPSGPLDEERRDEVGGYYAHFPGTM